MRQSPRLNISDRIYESSNSQIYRIFDENLKRPAILKKLNKGYLSPEQVSKFYREYELTSMFANEGVIKVYEIIKINNTPAIIMEDIGGTSLAEIIKTEKLSLCDFFSIAPRITEIIGNIHSRKIIHKDINPSNIIWNRKNDIIRIIDFGIATELPREITSVKNPNILEGTVSYISPEQTGRMNRSIDYRTDFYSLGVTFYHLLTGKLPFESADLLKLIHNHIAVMPVPPHEITPSIPEVLSEMITKLMAKNAEDRYNSAFGIKADLERCREDYSGTGSVKYFAIALHDVCNKFQIPQKLYGRESEIEAILSAFERVSKNSAELMLVSGFSGIGKSVLINEIQKPIVRYSGYFISGKFEKLKKDVPYSGLIQAFTSFAKQILAEKKDDISYWKEKILSAVGSNGRIISDIIPLFELIIGSQPEIPALAPAESQNRFRLVFKEFIKVMASKEHPLVLFLDDMQWIDPASLQVIKIFTTDSDIKHLFVIGAYRNNETPGSHPLMLAADDIRKTGAAVNTLFLGPLSQDHIRELLEDTLNRPNGDTENLARVIIRKTEGNPFFVNEFLNYLYKKELFEFSYETGWSWKITGIEEIYMTENVVDLMTGKITALPAHSQEILKLAACTGSYFNLPTLLTISDKDEDEVRHSLNEILKEGLINKIDDLYRFSHDRIQEAAYSLIPDAEKSMRHYHIGRLELKNTGTDHLSDKIFYIVNHLNSGSDMISSEIEKKELAELNLHAGKKALASNAYGSSLNYFKAGIRHIDENLWESDYHFTLEIYQEAVISAQLSADYASMEQLSETVLSKGKTILDKIRVYEALISAFIAQNNLHEAVRTGLHVLRQLGIKLSHRPGKLRIILSLLSLKFFLSGKHVDNLVNLPEMKDPHKLAVMQILSGIGTSAYYTAPELLPLVIFNAVRLSVKYGNSIYSPYSYAGFGIIHCGPLGAINTGYEYGRLALNLLDKYTIRETRSRVLFVVWFVINHWKRPIRDSLSPLLEGYKSGLDAGEFEFAALSASTYSNYLLFSGVNLEKVESEMAKYAETIRKFNQDIILTQQMIYYHHVLSLRGKAENPSEFIGPSYDRNCDISQENGADDISTFFFIYFYKLNLEYIFENYDEALKNAEIIKPYTNSLVASPYVTLFCFYDSLTRLALYPKSDYRTKNADMKAVKINQKKMKKWAAKAPMNYRHKYHLVEAEIARLKNNKDGAIKHYKASIKLAHENEFIQEEALALKLYSQFWIEQDENKIAALYMTDAYNTYSLWGASAVCEHIEKNYGDLINLHNEEKTISSKTSSTGTSHTIDLTTVIKASQTLSEEIDLGRLLETFMKLSIENAGAQRGFLIIENEDDKNLYIEVEGEPDRISRGTGLTPIENSTALSSSIVHYVNRTGDNVVLNNACKEGPFKDDPYVKANKILSLQCSPIMFKGKTSGILYLENNLTTNVFTPGRIKLLNILSSQAAISVENARLLIHRENKAKLEKEIEMAEKIQRSLLPEKMPDIRGINAAFKYIPMMGVGGDFINIYHKEDNRLGLFICDVSGHGVYAAMIASMVSNSLDFFWETYFESPSTILSEMSRFLKGKMGGNFFTCCLCSIDLNSNLLIMANAGHPPLLILKQNGSVEIKNGKGRLISEFFNSNAEDISFTLENGDKIVMYTDGIIEAQNSEKILMVEDEIIFSRWIQALNKKSSSAAELCENVYKGVIAHTGTEQLEDDFTILALEYRS